MSKVKEALIYAFRSQKLETLVTSRQLSLFCLFYSLKNLEQSKANFFHLKTKLLIQKKLFHVTLWELYLCFYLKNCSSLI